MMNYIMRQVYIFFFQAALSKNRTSSPPFRAIYLKRCFFIAKIFKHYCFSEELMSESTLCFHGCTRVTHLAFHLHKDGSALLLVIYKYCTLIPLSLLNYALNSPCRY